MQADKCTTTVTVVQEVPCVKLVLTMEEARRLFILTGMLHGSGPIRQLSDDLYSSLHSFMPNSGDLTDAERDLVISLGFSR